jgi:hypothetical protein
MESSGLPIEGASFSFKDGLMQCCATSSSGGAYMRLVYGESAISTIRSSIERVLRSDNYYSKYSQYLIEVRESDDLIYIVYSGRMNTRNMEELETLLMRTPSRAIKLSDLIRHSVEEDLGEVHDLLEYLNQNLDLSFLTVDVK